MTIRSCLIASCLASVAVFAAAWVIAQETLPAAGPVADPLAGAPPTDARHYSYAIGQQIGQTFREGEIELDADSLLAGLKDALSGAEPKYSEEICGIAMQRMYQAQMAVEEKHQKLNEDYLVTNAKAEGVVTLPSGLQYKVLASGTAGPSPGPTSTVHAKYRGTYIDGKMFDESGDEPAEFQVDGVIDGWAEALQLMKVGDKWQLVVPAKLGYPEGRGEIPPGRTLIFEVELVSIDGK